MATTKGLAAHARRRLFGRREVGLDPETITARVRLGRAKADARNNSWPHNAADVDPFAARLIEASRRRP